MQWNGGIYSNINYSLNVALLGMVKQLFPCFVGNFYQDRCSWLRFQVLHYLLEGIGWHLLQKG